MAKHKPKLQSARNVCLPSAESKKQVQMQMTSVKKAVHRSIVLTMVSSITFLLSVAIVMGVMNTAGAFALVGTATLLVASVAAAFEAKTLFHSIKEERRVDQLKTEFISLASHQLRTPLSSLKWYAELLSEEKGLTKDQKDYAKEMVFAVRRMNNLIDSLLHTAQLECEEIVPRMGKVTINILMRNLTKDLKMFAEEKEIEISVHLPKKTIVLHTDAALLGVVLQNLFSNAVKYTDPKGKVGVHVEEKENAVQIIVSDNGIGIPKKDITRIYQRLFRASNVLKIDTNGNGLGLYITKMVIDSLGGTIAVKSMVGKGTTFTVTLPMEKTAAKKTKKKK